MSLDSKKIFKEIDELKKSCQEETTAYLQDKSCQGSMELNKMRAKLKEQQEFLDKKQEKMAHIVIAFSKECAEYTNKIKHNEIVIEATQMLVNNIDNILKERRNKNEE